MVKMTSEWNLKPRYLQTCASAETLPHTIAHCFTLTAQIRIVSYNFLYLFIKIGFALVLYTQAIHKTFMCTDCASFIISDANGRRDPNSTLQVSDFQKAKVLLKSFSLFFFPPSVESCQNLSETEASRLQLCSLSTATKLAQGLRVLCIIPSPSYS